MMHKLSFIHCTYLQVASLPRLSGVCSVAHVFACERPCLYTQWFCSSFSCSRRASFSSSSMEIWRFLSLTSYQERKMKTNWQSNQSRVAENSNKKWSEMNQNKMGCVLKPFKWNIFLSSLPESVLCCATGGRCLPPPQAGRGCCRWWHWARSSQTPESRSLAGYETWGGKTEPVDTPTGFYLIVCMSWWWLKMTVKSNHFNF